MVSSALLAAASLYWGIHNDGDTQRINIDHFTSGYVMGVKGEDIHLPKPARKASKVIVAVLDTGVDATNPELEEVISEDGFNFVDNNKNVEDTHGHGTHISGVIATQVTKNAVILPVKVVKTGPNAPIRPQEVEPGAGTALTENVAKGIVYAINKGAKVINLSLAWPYSIRSKMVDEAMALAEQKNVLVIASAANDGTTTNLYPCIYSNVICVGAHGPDGAFTYFSNYGSMVDLLAPGIAILSTWPMDKDPVTYAGNIGYEFRNGTSMAAPFVAGAAAELLSRGYSASETKSRLLLGTRATKIDNLYTTSVVGKFSTDRNKPQKFSRFGNLDVSNALTLTPQSLILPLNKARTEIQWNGVSGSSKVSLQFKNNWKAAKSVKISVADQTFSFRQIGENEIVSVAADLKIDSSTESTFDQMVLIEAQEEDGRTTSRKVPVSFSVNRLISTSTLPATAIRYSFNGLNPAAFSAIRSVINSDQSNDRELVLIKDNTFVLTRKGQELGRITIPNLTSDRVLNIYRISESSYALISTQQEKDEVRPSYSIKYLNSKLQLQSEVKLGTATTVLNENFSWKKTKDGSVLLWVSIGYTPPKELKPYDPWNKKAKDQKIQRIYYNDGNDLRTVSLADDEMPVQMLPNGGVLIAKGTSYYAKFFILNIDLTQQNKIAQKNEIQLSTFRMLLGLDGSNKVLSLKGSAPASIAMFGASTPGNMRGTHINLDASYSGKDDVLFRENTLDSLVQVSGSYADLDHQYYFAQTHYDLKFFRAGSKETTSTSLNRYSYIPSMIFARNFFPFIGKDSSGNGLPGIYIPANIANANISEVILADTRTGELKRPAMFHFETSAECSSLGNLIEATETSPAKQVFICGSEVVQIPLQL